MKDKKDEIVLSKEDLDAISKDIEEAQNKIKETAKAEVSAIDRAKEEARKEVEKEFELKKQAEELARKNEELQKQLEETNKMTSEKLDQFKAKIDDLTASKAVVTNRDPFQEEVAVPHQVDKWSDEKINQLEEESARKFFGDDYDDR